MPKKKGKKKKKAPRAGPPQPAAELSAQPEPQAQPNTRLRVPAAAGAPLAQAQTAACALADGVLRGTYASAGNAITCPIPGTSDEGSAPACFVCLETEGERVHGGCACRGSAGFGHVACFVEAVKAAASAATHRGASGSSPWLQCGICDHDFTGTVGISLARAHWDGVRTRAAEDFERLRAGHDLARALSGIGDRDAAHPIFEDVLKVKRRAFLAHGNRSQEGGRDDDPETLDTMGAFGFSLMGMGK